jgi:peptidoglycan/LPS O-acetylase OafA/YrhL
MTKTATAVRIPTARRAPVGTSPLGTFRRDVEGLRAVAAGLVVLFHAAVPGLRGGYVGIDVLFVISGYLITPLLMREVGGVGRVPFALGCLVGGSLAWAALHPGTWSSFSPIARAWEIGTGGLVALAGTARHRIPYRLAGGLSWLGLVLILAGALIFRPDTAFPGLAAAVPVLGAVLVLAGRGEGLLTLPPLQWLGRISYWLFLWHWPVLTIAAAAHGGTLPAAARCLLVLLGIGLAIATYALVELPIRRIAQRRGPTARRFRVQA